MRLLNLLIFAAGTCTAASVSFSGLAQVQGSGLGAEQTMMTSSGAGCVGWDGSSDVIGGALCESWSGILAPTGLNQTRTYSLSELATSLGELRIVFNPGESGVAPSIVLEQFVVMVFHHNGGPPVLTAALPAAFPIADGGSGTGISGFEFQVNLNSEEKALADHPTYRVGLAFTTTGHDGADETFFRFSPEQSDVPEVPEPSSAACLVVAFAAGGLVLRRRASGRRLPSRDLPLGE